MDGEKGLVMGVWHAGRWAGGGGRAGSLPPGSARSSARSPSGCHSGLGWWTGCEGPRRQPAPASGGGRVRPGATRAVGGAARRRRSLPHHDVEGGLADGARRVGRPAGRPAHEHVEGGQAGRSGRLHGPPRRCAANAAFAAAAAGPCLEHAGVSRGARRGAQPGRCGVAAASREYPPAV